VSPSAQRSAVPTPTQADPGVLDSDRRRSLVIELGADDVGLVEIEFPAGEDVLAPFKQP